MAWWEDPARELGLALVGMGHQPGSRNHHFPAADPSGLGPEAASLPCSVGLAFEGENSTLLLAPWSHQHFQSLSHPAQPPIFSHEPFFLCFRKK